MILAARHPQAPRTGLPGTVRDVLLTLVVCAIIAGCATQSPRPAEAAATTPADFPLRYYRDALARGEPVYRIDPRLSLVVIEVRRAGTLARLGHDHVIASHDLQGLVAPTDGRADLYVALDRLVIDETQLRSDAGFDTQPSEDDIAGTRRNMLNALQAEQYPFARVAVSTVDLGSTGSKLKVALTLQETTRQFEVPVQIESAIDAVSVKGSLAFLQTDFGMKPLSVLGGAIQVQDQIDLRFQIRATRIWRADDT